MRKIVMIFAISMLVSACGHKDLTAPCSLRESPKSMHNTVLAFAVQDTAHLSSPFADMRLDVDRCGLLKPINSFTTKPNGVSDG